MVIYQCDVCEKREPSRSMAAQLAHAFPLGWKSRRGLDRQRCEVRVFVCSEACAKVYDQLELDEAGPVWSDPLSDKELPVAHPLRARR